MIDRAKQKGFSISRVCTLLMISRRRIVRWRNKSKRAESLENLKPGSRKPLHKLLPMERDAVLHMAKEEKYADLGHRILAVAGWDLGRFFVSFSSVYRIMRCANLMSMRASQRAHNGRSLPGGAVRFCEGEKGHPALSTRRERQAHRSSPRIISACRHSLRLVLCLSGAHARCGQAHGPWQSSCGVGGVRSLSLAFCGHTGTPRLQTP